MYDEVYFIYDQCHEAEQSKMYPSDHDSCVGETETVAMIFLLAHVDPRPVVHPCLSTVAYDT